jgi:hypothetical protein
MSRYEADTVANMATVALETKKFGVSKKNFHTILETVSL